MWPQATCTIHRKDILPNETDGDEGNMEIDNANLAEAEDQPIPERSTFTCLRNVDLLQTAFRVPGPSMSFIVLHEERL